MTRTTHTLDLDAPLRSLLAIVDVTQEVAAEARGINQGSVSETMRAGDRLALATLRAYVEALGYALTIVVEEKSTAGEK